MRLIFSILLVCQYGWFCTIPTYEIIDWILPPTFPNYFRERSKTAFTTVPTFCDIINCSTCCLLELISSGTHTKRPVVSITFRVQIHIVGLFGGSAGTVSVMQVTLSENALARIVEVWLETVHACALINILCTSSHVWAKRARERVHKTESSAQT